MCSFFQGREIDGKKRYGAAINTERGSEGITMGVTAAMYAWGMEYENPNKPYDMEGFFNSPQAVEAVEFYRKLYEDCAPPGHSDAYMVANLDAYKSGQVAFQMNWYAFWPGVSKEDKDGRVSGFFANPKQNVAAATLGGQGISVVKYSDKQDLALEYIKWFARPDVQQKWWDLGGYSCHNDVLDAPSFPTSTVYAQGFLDSMGIVKDFWQEPTFVELMLPMQEAIHDYVVNGKGTAKGALDKIIEEWVEVFEADGKL
jgi:multiple sugar transport system substrate-binding protein